MHNMWRVYQSKHKVVTTTSSTTTTTLKAAG
jgi:hypothetical protein